ncbi:hypothetical protein CIP101434_02021 [Corynebacterium diphtheriae]|nr:hypothetical protein CIP101280_01711 [Corynebacterium diphtheriae]CAB0524901.1 hypothetical protein CIP101434_02021 [Corynebacterium diphtheriae]CAB0813490.1 hypothetical protein FRC0263_01947 [Corynebacterium diphtheriae]
MQLLGAIIDSADLRSLQQAGEPTDGFRGIIRRTLEGVGEKKQEQKRELTAAEIRRRVLG